MAQERGERTYRGCNMPKGGRAVHTVGHGSSLGYHKIFAGTSGAAIEQFDNTALWDMLEGIMQQYSSNTGVREVTQQLFNLGIYGAGAVAFMAGCAAIHQVYPGKNFVGIILDATNAARILRNATN